MSAPAEVRAAGGLVLRHTDEGTREVLAVHRPRYDDWSLPKGKLRPGEEWEAAALREVEEETGVGCAIERELRSTAYRDRKNRRKLVRYWLMRPLDDARSFTPNDEVDAIRWLTPEQAQRELSYEHDRALVREALAAQD